MTIATKAQLDAARRFRVRFTKTAMIGAGSFQARGGAFASGGDPPAGTLAGSSTGSGVVPTDATAGFPSIPSFGGLDGHIVRMDLGSNNIGRPYWVSDLLFKAGAYAHNANTPLASQPTSWHGRLPGGDFKGLEIWVEAVTTLGGTVTVTINYDDEAGAPRVSTTTLVAAMDSGRLQRAQLPSVGVSKITNVQGSGGSAGTFNVLILRRLVNFLYPTISAPSNSLGVNFPPMHYLQTGLARVYEDSALYVVADTTAGSRAVGIDLEIAIG
jgi:hypothetical protein